MIRIKVLASIAMINRRVTIIRNDDTITAKISRATAEPQKQQLQPVNAQSHRNTGSKRQRVTSHAARSGGHRRDPILRAQILTNTSNTREL